MGKPKLIFIFLIIPILVLIILNFLAVFTPEIGFDALWYHLTLPKLWLLKGQHYFSGGLLYYSVMPRLTETIFIPLIKFTDTVGPKMLQFLSGVGISIYIWKISKMFNLNNLFRLSAISLFYCTWLVSWESSSAYIDLFRSFLEVSALYYFLSGKKLIGGIYLGLALGTKWLVLFSCLIYALVFGVNILIPVGIVALPWFWIAFHFTGNPVYPLFSSILQNGFQSPLGLLKNIFLAPISLTIPFDDFISPLIGILFVISCLSLYLFKDIKKKLAMVGILGAFSTLVLSPPSARFLLPFLPAIIISAILVIKELPTIFYKYFYLIVFVSSLVIVILRLSAFPKYLPFLLGKQTAKQYLTSMSGRLPDTFIDSDNFVANNLPPKASYLIVNLHNLYYFPYNFDHSSWAVSSQKYDYLVTKGQNPSEIAGDLVHTNSIGIQIFKLK